MSASKMRLSGASTSGSLWCEFLDQVETERTVLVDEFAQVLVGPRLFVGSASAEYAIGGGGVIEVELLAGPGREDADRRDRGELALLGPVEEVHRYLNDGAVVAVDVAMPRIEVLDW